MTGVTLDPARRLPIYFRIARYGVLTFTFVDSDGNAYDVSDRDFELILYYKENSEKVLYTPAEITVSPVTNSIQFEFTILGTQNIKQDQYYYQLIVDGEKTWLNGAAFAHKGDFDGVCEPGDITVNTGDVVVNVIVSAGVGGNSSDSLIDWDLSTNLFPLGAAKGQRFYGVAQSTPTTLEDRNGDLIPNGVIATALITGASTIDPAQWALQYTII